MTDPDRATQGSGSQTVPGLITPEKLGHPVAHGADATRVIPDHMERTHFDLGRVQRLAETGCVLEFDLFGWEMACCNGLSDICLPNGGGRVRIIRRLTARGYGDRTVLSHDVCRKTRMHRYGGPRAVAISPGRVVPLMPRRGITQAQLDVMLLHTPRRLLTIVSLRTSLQAGMAPVRAGARRSARVTPVLETRA